MDPDNEIVEVKWVDELDGNKGQAVYSFEGTR